MEVLYFPSHRVLTETNHTTNTNPPFLTAFTVRAEWSLFSSLPLPLRLHLPSLSLLIFPPLALLPVSLGDTRVSLSFAGEGGDERQREAREREEACNDLSWWMQLARKCWPNGREAWRSDGRNAPITALIRSSVGVQWPMKVFNIWTKHLYQRNQLSNYVCSVILFQMPDINIRDSTTYLLRRITRVYAKRELKWILLMLESSNVLNLYKRCVH